MLGIASNTGLSQQLFTDFSKLATTGKVKASMTEHHLDGWGIAGYLGNWAVHFGRSSGGVDNSLAEFDMAAKKLLLSNSKISLSHLRKASAGDIRLENTHPFVFENWIFCHNGTVHDPEKISLKNINYEGTTDSEKLFHFIKSRLTQKNLRDYAGAVHQAVLDLREKCNYTSLTFLISNGDYLIGYRDFLEEDEYYTLNYSRVPGHVIFCSEKLAGFNWNEMKNNEIVIASKHGDFIHKYNFSDNAMDQRLIPSYAELLK